MQAPRKDPIARVRDWWWAGFAFLYPLLIVPWSTSRSTSYVVHTVYEVGAILGAVVLGLALERSKHNRSLVRPLAKALLRPPGLIVLVYASWAWVSAALSPDSSIALTGSLSEASNGAYEPLILLAIFAMVHAQVRADLLVARRIAWAAVASGLVLVLLAMVEVLAMHSVVQPGMPLNGLPAATLPGKGHLGGMIALATGIALGSGLGWVAMVLATGIGLTLNRASMIAIIPATFLTRPTKLRRLTSLSVAVVVGLGLGVLLGQRPEINANKDITSRSSLTSRSYLFLAAMRGIAARPVLGWGGGVFELRWTDYLSRKELSEYVEHTWGWGPVLKVIRSPGGYPVLLVSNWVAPDGTTVRVGTASFDAWHSHNQFLEIALRHGLVALALYVWLLILGLRGLRNGNPLSLGLLAYFVFLQLWFVIPETRGVMWVIWAAAIATSERTLRKPHTHGPESGCA